MTKIIINGKATYADIKLSIDTNVTDCRTIKGENLSFMDACDLLDGGVAKSITRMAWINYKVVCIYHEYRIVLWNNIQNQFINSDDRKATDWRVCEWA